MDDTALDKKSFWITGLLPRRSRLPQGRWEKDRDCNPAQNVWDSFSFFHKVGISMCPPTPETMLVFRSHGCVTNILESKKFNIVQGERGKIFLRLCLWVQIVAFSQTPRKKSENEDKSPKLFWLGLYDHPNKPFWPHIGPSFQMYFQDEVVQELKQIYAQLQEEEEWDLSLQSLQQVTQDIIREYNPFHRATHGCPY